MRPKIFFSFIHSFQNFGFSAVRSACAIFRRLDFRPPNLLAILSLLMAWYPVCCVFKGWSEFHVCDCCSFCYTELCSIKWGVTIISASYTLSSCQVTISFEDRVPALQMSCSDLTKWEGTGIVTPAVAVMRCALFTNLPNGIVAICCLETSSMAVSCKAWNLSIIHC